ncbi:MAG: sulfatase-like hydrolase/transferase, partial [Verrucomicrobiota bacterium]
RTPRTMKSSDMDLSKTTSGVAEGKGKLRGPSFAPLTKDLLSSYKSRVKILRLLLLLVSPLAYLDSNFGNERPNILIVLADDLGYGDIGCYDNEIVHTPHLDQFAKEGIRFTDCYSAAPNCSPARAGLMTGRIPWRIGIHNWIPMMSPMHLRKSEITIASLLRDSGYETCHSGKWHLNGYFNLPGQPQPDDHGFDHWFSVQNNALPNHRNPYNFVRNGVPLGEIEGYSADIVTAEAVSWLRKGRDPKNPFFLFLCYHEPHEPIATAEHHTRHYAHLEDPAEQALWGNITQLDAAFGLLLSELETLGLRENTLVFFTSDNGPALTGKHPYGSAGPLRAKKGHVRDGGIRVPGILRWPGRATAGVDISEPIGGVDWLPTLCEVAGVSLPADRTLDGTSLLPLLENREIERSTPLYWQFFRAKGSVKVATREGDWKLVARIDRPEMKPSGGITAEDIEFNRNAQLVDFELFQLREDVSEEVDRSASEPERFEAMKKRLLTLFEDVREESPVWPEWEFPRYEGLRIEWPEYTALRRPPMYED